MIKADSRLLRFMDRTDDVIAVIGQALLAAMVAVTFISVVGRTFFSHPLPDDVNFSELMMVAVIYLPLGYVQREGAHLEVTVLTERLPQAVQSFLVSVGLVLGIVMFSVATYFSAQAAYEAYSYGTTAYASTLGLLEWPVRALIPVGFAWWCIRMLIHLIAPGTRPARRSELDEALSAAGEQPRP